MRSLVLALLGALLAAGCVSEGGVVEPGADPGPAAPAPAPPAPAQDASPVEAAAPPPEEPTFCSSESTCDFWDDDYHGYALYEPDTAEIDVLVVPSASADSARDTQVARAAIQAWDDGVDALGATWFAAGFTIRLYVLGQDQVPDEAMQDPEIVVLMNEHDPFVLLGLGLEPKQYACGILGLETESERLVHAHDGMRIVAADCTGGVTGNVCFAINTNFLFGSSVYLYDLVAHEVGHCLGPGHVGDALDFSAKRVPVQDIMSYQHDDAQVHCVSTLNLRVMEGLYGHLLGQTGARLHAGDYYAMPRSQYSHVDCANP